MQQGKCEGWGQYGGQQDMCEGSRRQRQCVVNVSTRHPEWEALANASCLSNQLMALPSTGVCAQCRSFDFWLAQKVRRKAVEELSAWTRCRDEPFVLQSATGY